MSSVNGTSSPDNVGDPNENHGPVVTAVTIWMLAFSSAFVILRCISRLAIVKRWGWDDTLIMLAWVRITLLQAALNMSVIDMHH